MGTGWQPLDAPNLSLPEQYYAGLMGAVTGVCVHAGIFFLVPLNGFLLDRFGYGIVLLIINTLSLFSTSLQMLDNLEVQVWAILIHPLAGQDLYILGQTRAACLSQTARITLPRAQPFCSSFLQQATAGGHR